MSAPIITRELLERYMRATGWERDELGFWRSGRWQICTFSGAALWDELTTLARSERRSYDDIAARLGLCAAAEHCLKLAHEWDPPTEDDPGEERLVLENAAHEMLAWAGVDPERWAAAKEAVTR